MKKLSLTLTFLIVLILSIMAVPQTPLVEAQDFSISVTPGSQSHWGPGNATYYVTVSSSGGFNDRVVITATVSPGGIGLPIYVYPPGGVTPPPNGVAHAVIVVWIKDPSGYTALQTITVTGSSAGTYHTTSAALVLASNQAEFSLYSIYWSTTIHPGQLSQYGLNVFAIGAYAGTATLSAYGGPTTGATMYFNVTYAYITTPGLSTTTTRYVTLSVTTTPAVEPGSYPIEIRGTGSLVTHSYYVILVIEATGDFTIAASQDTLSVNREETGSITITVTSTGGFASKTNLKTDWVSATTPTGVTPSLSPSYVTLTSGGTKTSTLKIETTSSATLGTFKIMVTGTSYPRSHNVNITLTITSAADFTMTASPTSLSIVAGQTGTSTITIGSTGGFNLAVSMSFSWVGTAPAGVTPSLTAYSITPPAGGTGTATLSIATSSTTAAGSYVIRITGVSGTLTHSVDVTFTVTTPAPTPDFTISVSPSSAQIRQAQSGNFVVTIGSTNAFASAVALTLSGQPSGVTGTFSLSSLTPPSGGSITSTLTVSVGATATPGTYTLTITGTSGSLSHQASIALTVQAAGLAPGCIIATATYGSELSPEVQFLRSFRDQQVKSTFAGDQFMVAFNAWYYSFSPHVAQFIASNAFARAVMKVLLYPLIGILHLAAMTCSALSFSHELAVVMAGLVASALIGVVYFSPLAILVLVLLRRYRKTTLKMSQLRMLAIVWVASLPMILVGEVALLPALMMASTALFVLSTLALGALTAATALLRRIQ